MECIQVDGNDLFAMVKILKYAAKNARIKNRPVFIEALTYRLGDHTTADDARRYRDTDELSMWEKRDPVIRLRNYLEQRDLWSQEKEDEQVAFAETVVAGVVKNAEEVDAPTTNDMFDSMYESLTPELQKQRRTLRTSSLGQDPSQVPTQSQEGAVQ